MAAEAAKAWLDERVAAAQNYEDCQAIVATSTFQEQSKALAAHLAARAVSKSFASEQERCVAYNVLLLRNEFTDLLDPALFAVLVEDVWERVGTESHLPATQLLGEFCRKNHLDRSYLTKLEGVFVGFLFDQVEATRDFVDTSLNFALVVLLVSISFQFALLSLTSHTELEKGAQTPDPVLACVRVSKQRLVTFSESFCVIFSRGTVGDMLDGPDQDLQILLLEFLSKLFGDPTTADVFYSNDLSVIVDTIIRETSDLPPADAHLYLDCLYGLLRNSPFSERPHKAKEIARVLRSILDDDRYDHGSQQFAGMILLEFTKLLT